MTIVPLSLAVERRDERPRDPADRTSRRGGKIGRSSLDRQGGQALRDRERSDTDPVARRSSARSVRPRSQRTSSSGRAEPGGRRGWPDRASEPSSRSRARTPGTFAIRRQRRDDRDRGPRRRPPRGSRAPASTGRGPPRVGRRSPRASPSASARRGRQRRRAGLGLGQHRRAASADRFGSEVGPIHRILLYTTAIGHRPIGQRYVVGTLDPLAAHHRSAAHQRNEVAGFGQTRPRTRDLRVARLRAIGRIQRVRSPAAGLLLVLVEPDRDPGTGRRGRRAAGRTTVPGPRRPPIRRRPDAQDRNRPPGRPPRRPARSARPGRSGAKNATPARRLLARPRAGRRGSTAASSPLAGRDLVNRHRQRQALIGEVEPVHHLVVVVPRRRVGVPGERRRVRPLEEDDPAALLVEHRVLLGIVEAVLVVGHDLPRVDPGAERRVGLGVPDLAEERRAAERLHRDHHPSAAVRIPVDRAAVGQHGLAGLDVAEVQQTPRAA